MNILSIIGITLIILVISIFMKRYSPEFYLIFNICSISILFILVIPYIKDIISEFQNLFYISNISNNFQKIILKVIGICIVSQIASDICKDSGNLAIANSMSIFGKLSIIFSSMSIFKEFVNLMINLLKE